MAANDIQVGGNHYKEKPYQHWDFVGDAELPYYIGCATKYPSRWRTKHDTVEKQKEDLSKAIHYITKAKERLVFADMEKVAPYIGNFVKQFHIADRDIINEICLGNYNHAMDLIIKELNELGE